MKQIGCFLRQITAMMVAIISVSLIASAETITNVRGRQRAGSNLVDIYYDLDAPEGGTYTVEVEIEGRTNEVTAATFTGSVGGGVRPGRNHHIVWDAGIDWPDKKGDVKAVVTTTKENHKGVQLWAGGPYWATTNIGASHPWESGLYFWWGDTIGYRPLSGTFSFDFSSGNSAIYTYGKSVSELQSTGWVTRDGILAPEHDAAQVQWGEGWRMPTDQELDDLNRKCKWDWMKTNGVEGYVVRGRDNFAANSIFLPAAGYGYGTSLSYAGLYGRYWSSILDVEDYCHSLHLRFNSLSHGRYSHDRSDGRSVRPVQGDTN